MFSYSWACHSSVCPHPKLPYTPPLSAISHQSHLKASVRHDLSPVEYTIDFNVQILWVGEQLGQSSAKGAWPHKHLMVLSEGRHILQRTVNLALSCDYSLHYQWLVAREEGEGGITPIQCVAEHLLLNEHKLSVTLRALTAFCQGDLTS